MTDTTHDDLLERARFVVQLFRECDAIQLPHGPTEQVLIGMIDRIEELQAKLAQQDDLIKERSDEVQATVAAKLREAVEIYRKLSEGSPVGAADGQTYHVRYVTGDEFAQNILALIPKGAQAALDRVVAAERERGFWAGRSCGGSKAEIDAALAAIRKGGERCMEANQ